MEVRARERKKERKRERERETIDVAARSEYKIAIRAYVIYARVGIFIALPIVCSASFSRFSKIRQHLAATRLRYRRIVQTPRANLDKCCSKRFSTYRRGCMVNPLRSCAPGKKKRKKRGKKEEPAPGQTVEFGTIRPTIRDHPRRTSAPRRFTLVRELRVCSGSEPNSLIA